MTVPGDGPTRCVIGPGAQAELGLVLAGTPKAASCTRRPLAAAAGAAVEILQSAGVAAEAVVVPDGEAAKTAEVAAGLLGGVRPARADPHRRRRGLRRGSGHRPRRVRRRHLDCAVSASCRCPPACSAWSTPPSAGRPASTPRAGKNLVGAFHPPAAVLRRHRRAGRAAARRSSARGLAEVVKCGFIADAAILDLLEADPTGRRDTGELIERAVAGQGRRRRPTTSTTPARREFLNYGHTLGPRHRAGGGLRLAARRGGRGRAGLRRRARPARRAG